MAATVCLRCDWTGTTSSSTCPRCGAPLYARGDATSKNVPFEASGSEPNASERRWRGWIATVLVVVLAAAAFVTIEFFTPSKAPPPPPATGFEGYLVYAAPDDDHERLWVSDLAAGTIQPGPQMRAADPTRPREPRGASRARVDVRGAGLLDRPGDPRGRRHVGRLGFAERCRVCRSGGARQGRVRRLVGRWGVRQLAALRPARRVPRTDAGPHRLARCAHLGDVARPIGVRPADRAHA